MVAVSRGAQPCRPHGLHHPDELYDCAADLGESGQVSFACSIPKGCQGKFNVTPALALYQQHSFSGRAACYCCFGDIHRPWPYSSCRWKHRVRTDYKEYYSSGFLSIQVSCAQCSTTTRTPSLLLFCERPQSKLC